MPSVSFHRSNIPPDPKTTRLHKDRMPPLRDVAEIERLFSAMFLGAAKGMMGCWVMLALWLTYFTTLLGMAQGGVVMVTDYP